jgi:hypothetical protein
MHKHLMALLSSFILVAEVRAEDAKPACTVVESGFAAFDAASSAWDESRTVELRKCGEGYVLAVVDTKTKAVLSETQVGSPTSEAERWRFDGLTCQVKGASKKKPKQFSSKAVLGNLEAHDKNPKKGLREVWQADLKTGRWEKLNAGNVRCHEDEP